MLAPAVLVLTLAAGHPIPRELWVEPQQSFGRISAFRVRADLHTKDEAAAAALKPEIERQVEATLRSRGIAFTTAARDASPSVDETADLILDVHLATTQGTTATAWSFHVSQPVHLQHGQWAFAATWIVGDLLLGPADTLRQRVHDSLQPAIDEFCAAYLAARAAGEPSRPEEAPAPPPTPKAPRAPEGARL